MSKTVAISNDIHIRIVEKQTEIRKKYRVELKISEIVDMAIDNGIDNVDKILESKNIIKILN